MKSIAWDGKPISKPGMYAGIPMDVYHSQAICVGTSVSSSGLRKVLSENKGSPAHFFDQWDGNPNRDEPDDKAHFVLGRAVHHLMLGQPNFAREFIIRPDEIADPKTGEMKKWHGGRDACKDWIERAQRTGRTILSSDQVQDIKGMAMRLGSNPDINPPEGNGILSGQIERTIIFRDNKTGLFVKVRPDAIPTASGDFSDLKTTTSIQTLDVMRSITDFAYHQQMALIRTAAREVLKIEPSSFSLVFQEKKRPYCVRIVMLKRERLDLGEKQNRIALDLIARCIKEKHWPGPSEDDGPQYADLMPRYVEYVESAFAK